jgi:hypothetical protein
LISKAQQEEQDYRIEEKEVEEDDIADKVILQ